MPTKPRELFHQAHYNALAKEIRCAIPTESMFSDNEIRHDEMVQRGVLVDLALSLCRRFKQDNPRFDPIKFLSACSPDNDLYPLAELYEEEDD